eukprot:7565811-Pyramimonas_sp.AAC.1
MYLPSAAFALSFGALPAFARIMPRVRCWIGHVVPKARAARFKRSSSFVSTWGPGLHRTRWRNKRQSRNKARMMGGEGRGQEV